MFCPKCGKENQNTYKFCKGCGTVLPDFAEVLSKSQQFHFSVQTQNLTGQILDDRYRLEAKIGAGGMGDVYRATRLLIGDTVAIKILHTHLSRNTLAAERFRREAQTAIRLRHRNLVQIYDVGISRTQNVPYILMELAEGFTLRQIMNHNKDLPLDFVVTVIAQVCAALSEAHKIGIVHRDIKPENIIANQTKTGWQVKVLDFGIAKLYDQVDNNLTLDGSAMGTPQYMSPEQCLGETLDGRSDIYSLGIVLYEMFCGITPFKSASTSAIAIYQVQNTPPRPHSINPNINPQIEAVILRALSKKPEDRQQTAAELAGDLINVVTAVHTSQIKQENLADNKPEEIMPEVRENLESNDLSELLKDTEKRLDEVLIDVTNKAKDQPINKPHEPL